MQAFLINDGKRDGDEDGDRERDGVAGGTTEVSIALTFNAGGALIPETVAPPRFAMPPMYYMAQSPAPAPSPTNARASAPSPAKIKPRRS